MACLGMGLVVDGPSWSHDSRHVRRLGCPLLLRVPRAHGIRVGLGVRPQASDATPRPVHAAAADAEELALGAGLCRRKMDWYGCWGGA